MHRGCPGGLRIGARTHHIGLAFAIGVGARLAETFRQLTLQLLSGPLQLPGQLLLGLRARAGHLLFGLGPGANQFLLGLAAGASHLAAHRLQFARQLLLGLRAGSRQLVRHRLARGRFGLGTGLRHGAFAFRRGRGLLAREFDLALDRCFGLHALQLGRHSGLGVRLDEGDLGGVHLRIDKLLDPCGRVLVDVGLLLAVHLEGHRVDAHPVDQGVDLAGQLVVVGGVFRKLGVAVAHVIGLETVW